MELKIQGNLIHSESDLHNIVIESLRLSRFHGKNLDALFDVLSTDIERPITIVWINSSYSKRALGDRFDHIVNIMRKVEQQDMDWNLSEKFKLQLA